jgi:hypothetical protein
MITILRSAEDGMETVEGLRKEYWIDMTNSTREGIGGEIQRTET